MAINDQIFSQSSGVLSVSRLTLTGLPITATAVDYVLTQSKITVTNTGADREMVESSEGTVVGYGWKQIKPQLTIEANDISTKLIALANQVKNVAGTANAAKAILSDSIIGQINTVGTIAAITAIKTATLATNADATVYVLKRPAPAGTLQLYKFNAGVLVAIPLTEVFTTAPVITGTDEILVQFKVSLPTSAQNTITYFQRDTGNSGFVQLSFTGFDSEGNTTVSIQVPRAIILSSVNLDGEKMKFNTFPISFDIPAGADNYAGFKVITERILSAVSTPNLSV